MTESQMKLKKRKTSEVDRKQDVNFSTRVKDELYLHRTLYHDLFEEIENQYGCKANTLFPSIIRNHVDERISELASKDFLPHEINSFGVSAWDELSDIVELGRDARKPESFSRGGVETHIKKLLSASYVNGNHEFTFGEDFYSMSLSTADILADVKGPELPDDIIVLTLNIHADYLSPSEMHNTRIRFYTTPIDKPHRSCDDCEIHYFNGWRQFPQSVAKGSNNAIHVYSLKDAKEADKELRATNKLFLHEQGKEIVEYANR